MMGETPPNTLLYLNHFGGFERVEYRGFLMWQAIPFKLFFSRQLVVFSQGFFLGVPFLPPKGVFWGRGLGVATGFPLLWRPSEA